jgi:hypothetical protein
MAGKAVASVTQAALHFPKICIDKAKANMP